jgi:hypothetical protein
MFRTLFTVNSHAGSGCPGRGARRAMARAATLAAITVLALGTLSGTAQAQSVFTDLTQSFYTTNIYWQGGGDAEVNTKSGRFTDVIVQTDYPEIHTGGVAASIVVTYEIHEGAPNYTVLRRYETVYLFPPPGYHIVNAGFNKSPVNWSKRYFGQDHNWHNESAEVAYTYLRSLSVKFDGSGRDDQGNAAMEGLIALPVELVSN